VKNKSALERSGTVLGWEFNQRIELSVVQSRASTFEPGLAKKHQNTLNHKQKMPEIHQEKKVSWNSLMLEKFILTVLQA